MLRCFKDCLTPAEIPGMPEAELDSFAATAKPPTLYSPPQKDTCSKVCCYSWLRASCCCCGPCVRGICCGGGGARTVRISDPDVWFAQMLSYSHPDCPEQFKGVWWMQDNVAAEGVNTLQDAGWSSSGLTAQKSANYNWTVDSNNLWGMILTANFMIRGGKHLFQVSKDGKWISVRGIGSDKEASSHWIYVIQPGDVLKRPEGTIVDVTPGEDLLRVSYNGKTTDSGVFYQYLLRRVAYLDDDGSLVLTERYKQLKDVAQSGGACCSSNEYHIEDTQTLTLDPKTLKAPGQEAM